MTRRLMLFTGNIRHASGDDDMGGGDNTLAGPAPPGNCLNRK